jgi:hypothetical protein
VVVFASPGRDVELMRPDGDASYGLGIPACMVSQEAGQQLAGAISAGSVEVTFRAEQVGGAAGQWASLGPTWCSKQWLMPFDAIFSKWRQHQATSRAYTLPSSTSLDTRYQH